MAIEIREGTALARLVAETTTHGPEMALAARSPGIKLDIPPWLAAHYRRNHSEMPKAAMQLDPTGGYPLVLENLHAWMLLHQDLKPSEPPVFKAAAEPSVGPNVNISGDNDTPRSESDIQINPHNPKQVIAASNNIGSGQQAQFFSSDGGAAWGQTTLPLLTGDSLHSDPTVGWTSDGTAWATTIGINADSTVLQMRAYKSSDGGKTWVFDGTFSGNQTSADKQLMCVDHSPTSPFRDRIYVIWHNNRPAFVSFRNASGWHAPLQVSHTETTGTAIGSDITTNAAGTVFAVWPDTGSRGLFFVKSTDGGESFTSPPLLVAKTFASFQINLPAFNQRAALVGASIGAFSNQVYVAWTDLSGDDGCKTSNNAPGGDVNSPCTSRIWFARSLDAGQTWSQPAKINPAADRSDQFNQRLAVDPETGVIGIVYYATGTKADRKKTNLVFQFSSDGGQTWSKPATKVTSATSDETTQDADSGNQYGDYNGLSVAKGVFMPCWTDRRDRGAEAIFSARISAKQNAQGVIEAVVNVPSDAVPGPA
jgi:BNR/Asp-box repeat